jgi:hypothetical protein
VFENALREPEEESFPFFLAAGSHSRIFAAGNFSKSKFLKQT